MFVKLYLNYFYHVSDWTLIMFPCLRCGKVFAAQASLSKHTSRNHNDVLFTCEVCQKTFKRRDNLTQHITSSHKPAGAPPPPPEKKLQCHLCACTFTAKYNLNKHIRHKHQNFKKPGNWVKQLNFARTKRRTQC